MSRDQGKTRDHVTLGKAKVLPKHSMPSTHCEPPVKSLGDKYSTVTSKVIKTWTYFDRKPDIHAVKKKILKKIPNKINISLIFVLELM